MNKSLLFCHFLVYTYIYLVFYLFSSICISCILSFSSICIYLVFCLFPFIHIYLVFCLFLIYIFFFLLQRPSLSVRYARAISFPRPRISPQYVASRPYTSHGRDTDTSDMSLSRDIFISRRTSLLAPCPTCLAPPRVPLMPHPPPAARPPARLCQRQQTFIARYSLSYFLTHQAFL